MKWRCDCGNCFTTIWNTIRFDKIYACQDCRGVRSNVQLTQEFIEKECEKMGYKVLSKYKNNKISIIVRDKEGYMYYCTFNNLKNSNLQKFSKLNPYTLENIKLYIKLNNINVELLSDEYKDNRTKMLWRCSCGETFKANWSDFYSCNKHQCNKCGLIKMGLSGRVDKNFVKNKVEEMGYILLNEYTICDEHLHLLDNEGYKYHITWTNLRKKKPSRFHVENPFTIENVKHYMELNKMTCKLIDEEWHGNQYFMEFECECGEHFRTCWDNLTRQNKTLCDTCSSKSSSLERRVKFYLDEHNIKYLQEYSFDNLSYIHRLRFDFAIFDSNDNLCYLIEVQGLQHYQPVRFEEENNEVAEERYRKQVERDNLKREYCKEYNIPLLELKYDLFYNNSKKYINELNLFDLANRV